MALINLRSLGVTLGAPLFSNLNLSIEPATAWASSPPTAAASPRCCAASPAAFEPTSGDITRARGLRVGHVEQDVPDGLGAADVP